MGRRKGGRRGAHPSYSVMMTSKPKHKAAWKPGKATRGRRLLKDNAKALARAAKNCGLTLPNGAG